MMLKVTSKILFVCFLIVFAMPLAGCGDGGVDRTKTKGPEMGELQAYLNEHPELMDESSDDEDQEGEFDMAEGAPEVAPEGE